MCELLGMSFNLPVRPSVSFTGFRHRGENNPDGWGLASYPDKSAQIIKEPIKAGKSLLSKFYKDYQEVRSRIVIGHVRRSSVGKIKHRNTHPFIRELNGKEYVFAHNGTLANYDALALGSFKPIGETDSEYVFCYLLDCIRKKGITHWREPDFDWITGKLEKINRYGNFNCIFSDGDLLFCYHDKNGYNGLCYVHRKPPYGRIRLLDKDWEVNLAGEKNPEQTGFIIASKRLTNEPDEKFRLGEAIVFRDGGMLYSSQRNISETQAITLLEIRILKILREHPIKLSLGKITKKSKCFEKDVKSSISLLLYKGLVTHDGLDQVEWHHKNAMFYTTASERDKIDSLIDTAKKNGKL